MMASQLMVPVYSSKTQLEIHRKLASMRTGADAGIFAMRESGICRSLAESADREFGPYHLVRSTGWRCFDRRSLPKEPLSGPPGCASRHLSV
jgi:hypothetical protein